MRDCRIKERTKIENSIIGFFNFQFLVTHVTTAITCVTRVFTLFPIYLG